MRASAGVTRKTATITRSDRLSRLCVRLRDREWRRYGYLLIAGKALGIAALFGAMFLFSNVLGTGDTDSWRGKLAEFVDKYIINSQNLVYMTAFALLIIAFAYFYNSIAFDPVRQADQIRRQGGFIPGVRPGPQTERYLAKVVNRITLPGAVFIACVAIIPYLLLWGAGVSTFGFAGTSILIAVGVALELMRQIDSQLMLRNYEGFLK